MSDQMDMHKKTGKTPKKDSGMMKDQKNQRRISIFNARVNASAQSRTVRNYAERDFLHSNGGSSK